MTFKYFNVLSLRYLITCLQLKSYMYSSQQRVKLLPQMGLLSSLSNRNTYHSRLKRKHI